MALFIFGNSALGSTSEGAKNPLLFGKTNAEAHFCEYLAAMVKQHSVQIERMDSVKAEFYGSHSIRKGASTYISSVLEGPSTIALFQRAGWDIGTQRRYIHLTG